MFFTNNFFDETIFKFIEDDFFFNSSVRDMTPVKYYKKDNDYIIEVKTIGVGEGDIKVSLDENTLSITGETKNEYSDTPFNVCIKVRLSNKLIETTESIDYTSKNGVTYVFFKTKEKKEEQIKINKI